MASSDQHLEELAEIFRLMGDPNRLRILLLVMEGPLPVGEIAERTGLSPSLVSHNLSRLRAGRLVRSERQGKQVFYQAADAHVDSVLRDMLEHVAEVEPNQAPEGMV